MYPPRPEVTAEDLEILKARGKLRWTFESPEEREPGLSCLAKVVVPLNYNSAKEEPKIEENKGNLEENYENQGILEEKQGKTAENQGKNAENQGKTEENQVKSEANQEKIEENKLEESFIEPFDGSTFQGLREQYNGIKKISSP